MPKEPKIEYAAAIGSMTFPWDMLRYDFCSPSSESEDSSQLETLASPLNRKLDESTQLRVIVVRRTKGLGKFTPERWRSFGWELLPGFDNEHTARGAGVRFVEQHKKVKA